MTVNPSGPYFCCNASNSVYCPVKPHMHATLTTSTTLKERKKKEMMSGTVQKKAMHAGTCRSIRQLLTFPSIASNAAWPEPSPFATEKSVTLALLLIGCLSFLSCFAANREKIVLPRPSGIFVYRGGEWGEGGAERVLKRGKDWVTGVL